MARSPPAASEPYGLVAVDEVDDEGQHAETWVDR